MNIRNLKSLVVLFLAAVLAPVKVAAIDFTVDGISYNITSAGEVEVVAPQEGKYQGDITIPGGVTYNDVYYYVTAIGKDAFKGASVTNVTLPAVTIRTIKSYAFNDVSLTSFTVPASVTKIESNAFLYCDKMTDFYFLPTTPPVVASNSFSGMKKSSCVLHVPTGTTTDYQAVTEFAAFTNIAEWDLPEVYDLQIVGFPVSAINEDVFGDGTVVYSPTTTTLTINRDLVSPDNMTPVVYNIGVEGLTIQLNGCTLTSADAFCVKVEKETGMTGDATIKSTGSLAVYAWAPLSIIDANMDISGAIFGGNSYDLEIKNSNLTCNVTSGSVISGFHDVVLTDCFYRQPTEAVYVNGALKEGALDVSSLQIEAGAPVSYNLWIAGTQVTELNCDNIGGYDASYNAKSNTLTLNGDISATIDYPILNNISGLNIHVPSDVTLSSLLGTVLELGESTVISGSGMLTLKCPNDNSCIRVWDHLSIKDASVKLEDCDKGIEGVTISTPTLTIENSNVEGTALSGDAFIKDFTEVTLKDCYYEEPAGAKYENNQLVDMDGNVATSIKIVPGKEKKSVGLSFPRDVYVATVGKDFTAPEMLFDVGVAVEYASSNPDVATVDVATGEVTIKGKGLTTISATYSGGTDYYAEKASYYLVVSKQDGQQYDVNQDGKVTITDAVAVINAIENGGAASAPELKLEETKSE